MAELIDVEEPIFLEDINHLKNQLHINIIRSFVSIGFNNQHSAHQKEVHQILPTNEGDMRWPTCVYQRTGALKAAGDAYVQHPRSQVISTPEDEKNKEDLEDEKKGVEEESKSLLWNYKV